MVKFINDISAKKVIGFMGAGALTVVFLYLGFTLKLDTPAKIAWFFGTYSVCMMIFYSPKLLVTLVQIWKCRGKDKVGDNG